MKRREAWAMVFCVCTMLFAARQVGCRQALGIDELEGGADGAGGKGGHGGGGGSSSSSDASSSSSSGEVDASNDSPPVNPCDSSVAWAKKIKGNFVDAYVAADSEGVVLAATVVGDAEVEGGPPLPAGDDAGNTQDVIVAWYKLDGTLSMAKRYGDEYVQSTGGVALYKDKLQKRHTVLVVNWTGSLDFGPPCARICGNCKNPAGAQMVCNEPCSSPSNAYSGLVDLDEAGSCIVQKSLNILPAEYRGPAIDDSGLIRSVGVAFCSCLAVHRAQFDANGSIVNNGNAVNAKALAMSKALSFASAGNSSFVGGTFSGDIATCSDNNCANFLCTGCPSNVQTPVLSSDSGSEDAFLTKVTDLVTWPDVGAPPMRFGDGAAQRALGVASDGTNAFFTGEFAGSIDLGNGDTYSVAPGTGVDAFVAARDGSLAPIWTRHFGGPADASGKAIGVGQGRVVVAGTFSGTIPAESLQSKGLTDVLAADLEAGTGKTQRICSYGGAEQDEASSLAMSPDGGAFVAGMFKGNASFGAVSMNGEGGSIFLVKLAPPPP